MLVISSLFFVAVLAAACSSSSSSSSSNGGGSDTGAGDGAAEEREACGTTCPTPLPSSGTDPAVVFRQVRFGDNSEVVLQNLTTEDVDLSEWMFCQRPNYVPVGDVTIDASSQLVISLDGTSIQLGDTDELALYSSASFDTPDDVVAYVRWGAAPVNNVDATRQTEAVTAGLWNSGDFVEMCDTGAGILATGNVRLSRGWRAVTDDCF
jgi:hypothetical protein